MAVSLLISDLRTALGTDKVALPSCERYKQGLKRWAASIEKPAAVIVFPTSSQDVSIAIQLATKHSVPLTTVCGGHGTSGDSSIADGLLINMRSMNTVRVDTAALTISCAGGCTWKEIDAATAPHNISSVGGTVNQTGVAGYTTGGGFGWLSGKHGLAIDNLLSAEIVLADGRIVRASATQEPDLFWAIRGAGHMFGVITEFVFQGYHQPKPVYGGMVVFPPSPPAIDHLINFANNLAATSDGRAAMMCGFATPPGIGKRIIFGTCFYDGSEEEGAAVFAPLVAGTAAVKPIRSTLASMPYLKMNEVLAMAGANEGRRVSKGVCYSGPLPPAAFKRVLAMYEAFVSDVPEAGKTGSCLFEFYALDKIASVPATATAYVNRGRHANAMIIPCWQNADKDDLCRQFAQDAMEAIKAEVRAHRKSSVEGEAQEDEVADYLNYDGLGTPAAQTFGVNYPRLRALKERYDPSNVFAKRSGLLDPSSPSPADTTEPADAPPTPAPAQAEAPVPKRTKLSPSSPSSSPSLSPSESSSSPSSSPSSPGSTTLTTIEAPTHQKLDDIHVSVTALPVGEAEL